MPYDGFFFNRLLRASFLSLIFENAEHDHAMQTLTGNTFSLNLTWRAYSEGLMLS